MKKNERVTKSAIRLTVVLHLPRGKDLEWYKVQADKMITEIYDRLNKKPKISKKEAAKAVIEKYGYKFKSCLWFSGD